MYTLIESIEDLEFLNQELLTKPFVGVDTEFRRTTKDNMRLALLQVNDDDEIYLIDTIAIKDPKECASFLFSDSVTKIFHSCKEDLEAIFSWTGKAMNNIFDTQIANAFLDDDYSISYQSLAEKRLGIILEKKETRSNWIRRPLSNAQLKYAALDVEYLIHLFKEQHAELKSSYKLEWHNEDVDRLIKVTFNQTKLFTDLGRTMTKARESELLLKMNQLINEIALENKINPTLFFSKKSQKDFLRLASIKGLDSACEEITPWRRDLIKDSLLLLLEE